MENASRNFCLALLLPLLPPLLLLLLPVKLLPPLPRLASRGAASTSTTCAAGSPPRPGAPALRNTKPSRDEARCLRTRARLPPALLPLLLVPPVGYLVYRLVWLEFHR